MNKRQAIFRDWAAGILLYAVVLGFFNDYTGFITIASFSTIFFAALVLQALTYWTLSLKKWVGSRFSYPENKKFKPGKIFSIWAILFFSKFVFLAVIDFVFGTYVEISGFIGLTLIILIMTVTKEALSYIFNKLGDSA